MPVPNFAPKKKSRGARSSGGADTMAIAKLVHAHADELTSMSEAKEFVDFAQANDLWSKKSFPAFKTALKQLDIDYDEVAATNRRNRIAELAEAAATAPTITLFAAGDDEVSSYAICLADGTVAWYNTFHEDDSSHVEGDQDSADRSAAGKAIFLAGQAREWVDADAIRLTLRISNHRLDVEDKALANEALKARVALTLDVVDDEAANPALEWCREAGSKQWRETSLQRVHDAQPLATVYDAGTTPVLDEPLPDPGEDPDSHSDEEPGFPDPDEEQEPEFAELTSQAGEVDGPHS